jgi:hypothetical protein
MDDASGTQEAIKRTSRRGLEGATPPLEFGERRRHLVQRCHPKGAFLVKEHDAELGGTKPCRIG